MYGKKILNADAQNASTPQYCSNVKIIPLIEYPTITTGTPEIIVKVKRPLCKKITNHKAGFF